MGFGDSYKESMNNWRNATEKAIALDPYDGEARLLLGWYYQFLNDYDRTVAELDRAIELNPNNADVLGLAALLLTKSGQPERALHLAEQSIRLNPHHPDWYYGPLRDSYFYSGRFEEAIAATRKRLHPNPVYDPLVRAMSYAQLGRAQEASHEVATLLEANPDYSAEKFLSETGTFARDLDLKPSPRQPPQGRVAAVRNRSAAREVPRHEAPGAVRGPARERLTAAGRNFDGR
jgi:adenylate cyclase